MRREREDRQQPTLRAKQDPDSFRVLCRHGPEPTDVKPLQGRVGITASGVHSGTALLRIRGDGETHVSDTDRYADTTVRMEWFQHE